MALTKVRDAVMPAGAVLQVVSDTLTTAASTNSTTYSDTGLSVSITPISSSSKFVIMTNLGILSTGLNNAILLRLLRDSTEINSGTGGTTYNSHITDGRVTQLNI